MTTKRITIELVGSAFDKQNVRLNDFIEQLRNIKEALIENELAISGAHKATVDYKVVDLRHNSPATIVLEPVSLNGLMPAHLLADVPQSFTNELRQIRDKKKLVREPDLSRLEAYRRIGAKEKSRIKKVKITYDRKAVTIDEKFQENLNEIVGPDELVEGSISGTLEALNFHNTNKFTLYPQLGPKKIAGMFPQELRPRVKEAIDNFVTIYGKLRYKAWSSHPHGIIANTIDIHEPDSELPSLFDMRGSFAGSTGKLNSVEYIDKLRNEDW